MPIILVLCRLTHEDLQLKASLDYTVRLCQKKKKKGKKEKRKEGRKERRKEGKREERKEERKETRKKGTLYWYLVILLWVF